MSRWPVGLTFAAVMVVVIVALDVLVFRGYPWPRLAANVGLVLVAVAFYYRFFMTA